MRIGLLTHSVNPRGGVVHTLALAEALQALGHEACVFAPAAPGQRLFRDAACDVSLVPVPPVTADTAAMVAARIDAFREHLGPRLDAFDMWHAQEPIGANALAHLEDAGRLDGYLRTVHHLDDYADPRLAAWQARSVSRPRRLCCVSRVWRDRLRDVWGRDAELVPNGVDLARWSPKVDAGDADVRRRLRVSPDAPLVLAIGGIEARKNTLALVEAFARLRADRPQARLVLAGGASVLDHSAYRARVDAAFDAFNLRDAVVVTGPLPDAEMPALMRAADVLAMPSLNEGFGLVVLEALACGTPAVVSAIAPFTEHLPGEAGVHWCDPVQPASIAQALAAAIDAPPFDAPPAVCRRYDWSASAAVHLALYRRLREPADLAA